MDSIRNFVIIAHIDSGKSTLADRLLEITGTVEARNMRPQYLDKMELERERGITIKMAPVRMLYAPQTNADYTQTNADSFLYPDLTYKIRGIIFAVRKKIGLGHKEVIYQRALEEEFRKAELFFEREKVIDLMYDDKKIGIYKPDFVVDSKIILELKSLPFLGQTEEKQLWSYLKSSPYKLALLVNFGGKDIEIKRVVYDTVRGLRESASSQCQSAEVEYILNLIDTPGHSDFSYEVSRALAAVEGAILLVDGTKGIQAQTLSNLRAARKAGLKIIGAVNKVDLDLPQLPRVIKSTAELLEVPEEEIFKVSAKTGLGVAQLLNAAIEKVPPPRINADYTQTDAENSPRRSASSPRQSAMSRSLIFDSLYDDHKGILAFVRVFGGEFRNGEEVELLATGAKFRIKELGFFVPEFKSTEKLSSGEIGYIATGLKEPTLVKIGDTVAATSNKRQATGPALPGYREPTPVVFISFYPDGATKFEELHRGLERLRLTDAALHFEPDANEALGRGFKVGFLGQLHFEIIASRLQKEFNLKFLTSFPSIAYRVLLRSAQTNADSPLHQSLVWGQARTDAESSQRKSASSQPASPKLQRGERKSAADGTVTVTQPQYFPDRPARVWQPMIKLEILVPQTYLSSVVGLKNTFDFEVQEIKNIGDNLLILARMPLAELIRDFDDRLKSASSGYASFSYEIDGEDEADVEKLEILIVGDVVAALTRIVAKKDVEREGRSTVERLKELLPKQQFSQALQARAEGRIIARETIPAMKKDVTGYLYGGDRSRKMKLWKKQQRGKEKLKGMARVELSPEVFREILKK